MSLVLLVFSDLNILRRQIITLRFDIIIIISSSGSIIDN